MMAATPPFYSAMELYDRALSAKIEVGLSIASKSTKTPVSKIVESLLYERYASSAVCRNLKDYTICCIDSKIRVIEKLEMSLAIEELLTSSVTPPIMSKDIYLVKIQIYV